jgi:hypothetical protein
MKLGNHVGTVGVRLHYENNTIQHDGIFLSIKKQTNQLGLSHLGLKSYYNFKNGIKEVIGSTAALLMIRKNVFEKIGHFNENYTECFEDVELNLSLYINGYKNYYVGNAVAYHYESQTRNESDEKQKRMNDDFNDLVPFIQKNINKLSEKIIQY